MSLRRKGKFPDAFFHMKIKTLRLSFVWCIYHKISFRLNILLPLPWRHELYGSQFDQNLWEKKISVMFFCLFHVQNLLFYLLFFNMRCKKNYNSPYTTVILQYTSVISNKQGTRYFVPIIEYSKYRKLGKNQELW